MDLAKLSFDWDSFDGQLSGLKKNIIFQIMEDYYNSDLKVSDILNKYDLPSNIRSLSKEFPLFYTENKCPYDGVYLVKQMPSRSSTHSYREAHCPVCGHKNNGVCNCKGCHNKRLRIERDKRKLIRLEYSTENIEKVKYDSLLATDKIYLATIIQCGLSENGAYIVGHELQQVKLSPTDEFDKEIMDHLISKRLIIVDPESPLRAFPDKNFPHTYYTYGVNYLINVEVPEQCKGNLSVLRYPMREEIINCKRECLGIWKRIALYECLEYLSEQMKEAKFDFNPKEKTRLVLNHLIEIYSIGEIWNLIYGSVNKAAAWYQKSSVSKRHAANSVITTLDNRGARAKNEHWKLNPYHRSYNCELSQVSMIFFDSILKIGRDGYEKVPSIDLIE